MINATVSWAPSRPSITDPEALQLLRAGQAVSVGRLSMTAEPDGSSFT